jgi:hypothetical protein
MRAWFAFSGAGGHVLFYCAFTDYLGRWVTTMLFFISLTNWKNKMKINIYYKGQRYKYRVVEKTIVDPSQVEYC